MWRKADFGLVWGIVGCRTTDNACMSLKGTGRIGEDSEDNYIAVGETKNNRGMRQLQSVNGGRIQPMMVVVVECGRQHASVVVCSTANKVMVRPWGLY